MRELGDVHLSPQANPGGLQYGGLEEDCFGFFSEACLRFLSTSVKMDCSGGRKEAKRSVRNLGRLYKVEIRALEKTMEKRRWEKAGCERRNGN